MRGVETDPLEGVARTLTYLKDKIDDVQSTSVDMLPRMAASSKLAHETAANMLQRVPIHPMTAIMGMDVANKIHEMKEGTNDWFQTIEARIKKSCQGNSINSYF